MMIKIRETRHDEDDDDDDDDDDDADDDADGGDMKTTRLMIACRLP